MRLMAHLSGDPDLLKVFADGGDVFRKIAAALRGGGKRAEDITDEERGQVRRAWNVSFIITTATTTT